MNEIALKGCTPIPLGSYLKSLGIFRIISEQFDKAARCTWKGDHLVILTHLSKEELRESILSKYRPTPIISPWNGRAGFLEGDDADDSNRKGAVILREIINSRGNRFSSYRSMIESIMQVSTVKELNTIRSEVKRLEEAKKKKQDYDEERLKAAKSEEKELKGKLVTSLRSELNDIFLPWLDACLVLIGEGSNATPLLGSGGNEGSMDYSVNHLILLSQLIDSDSDQPTDQARVSIDAALFGDVVATKLHGNPGFLNPTTVGGVNMSTGYSGSVGDNAWDTVLMLEGAVLFAATATRRYDSDLPARLSQAFMFDPVYAGHGGIAPDESSRPEFWAPLWGRLLNLDELKALLAEGRATLRGQKVKNGLDMARAVASYGVDRGLTSFQRFGLYERRGQGYYVAAPLKRVNVTRNLEAELLSDLDENKWLSRFRQFARGEQVARRFIMLRKRLEDALFEFAGTRAGPAKVQSLLALLGEIQFALSQSSKAQDANVGPVPLLSPRWILGADDGTPAYRISRALASLRGEENHPLPMRAQLYPVHPYRHDWIESVCNARGANKDPACRVRLTVPWSNRLVGSLGQLLERRLWLAEQFEFEDKPLNATAGVGLDDLYAFLLNPDMDQTIAALLPAFSLVRDIPEMDKAADGETVPAAVGLLKLMLTPDRWLRKLADLPNDQRVPVPPGLLALLESGNPSQAERAIQMAWRRLRGSGLTPAMPLAQCPQFDGIDPRRVAASLLVPFSYGAAGKLAKTLLESEQTEIPETA